MKSNQPFDKRESKDDKKAFKATGKTVNPVAKDTNKTRRKETKKRIVGVTEKASKPMSHLKRDMHKPNKTTSKGDC